MQCGQRVANDDGTVGVNRHAGTYEFIALTGRECENGCGATAACGAVGDDGGRAERYHNDADGGCERDTKLVAALEDEEFESGGMTAQHEMAHEAKPQAGHAVEEVSW